MKRRAVRLIRKAQALTAPLCERCPDGNESRCCSGSFCAIVEAGLAKLGEPAPDKPGYMGVPFLGESGCVVRPEMRPGCSGFLCPGKARDKMKARAIRLVLEAAEIDKDAAALVELETGLAVKLLRNWTNKEAQ